MRNSETNRNRGNHVHLDIELLSAYIDGEVTPDEVARVERHLPGCRRCAEELESLRWTVNLLREAPLVTVPRSFTIRPVDLEPETRRRRFTLPGWLFRGLQWATVATAVLTILVFAADFLNIGQPAGAPLSMLAAQEERAIRAPKALTQAQELPTEKEAAPPKVMTVQTERDRTLELAGGPAEVPAATMVPGQSVTPSRNQPLIGQTEIEVTREAVPQAGALSEAPAYPAEEQGPAAGYAPPPAPEPAGRAAAQVRPRDPLRTAGIGLTGVFVALLGLTLWARRQRD